MDQRINHNGTLKISWTKLNWKQHIKVCTLYLPLIGTFVALNSYNRKRSKTNYLSLYLKKLEKEQIKLKVKG